MSFWGNPNHTHRQRLSPRNSSNIQHRGHQSIYPQAFRIRDLIMMTRSRTGVVRKLWTCCVVFLGGLGGGGFCLWWVLGELVFLRLLVGSSRLWCVVVGGCRRLQSMWPRLYVPGLWWSRCVGCSTEVLRVDQKDSAMALSKRTPIFHLSTGCRLRKTCILAVVIDCYSRHLTGFAIADHMRTGFSARSHMDMAKRHRNSLKGAVFH